MLEGVGVKEFTEWHINNFPGERVCQPGEVLLEHPVPQLKSIAHLIPTTTPIENTSTS